MSSVSQVYPTLRLHNFVMLLNKKPKTFKKKKNKKKKKTNKQQKQQKKKNTLHMQATPDDGLWKIRKRSGQFW